MRKKIAVITIIFMSLLTFNSYASEKNIAINEFNHDELIRKAKEDKNNIKNEYEKLKELYKLSKQQLKDMDLNTNDLVKMEKDMLKEIKRRSKLDKKSLENMGYSDKEIDILTNLDNAETLEQISALRILANCTTYNTLGSHTYDGTKTYFKVYCGYEWDKMPSILINDTLGAGWNGDYSLDYTKSSAYNKFNISYQDSDGGSYYEEFTMYENQVNTSEIVFPLAIAEFPIGDTWAHSGSAIVYLSQVGIMENAKFSFKYGHNTIGGNIGIQYPWGVGFSFDGAEYIYQPQAIVNSQKDFY